MKTKRSEQFIYQYSFRRHRQQLGIIKPLTHTYRPKSPVDAHQLFLQKSLRKQTSIERENQQIIGRIKNVLIAKRYDFSLQTGTAVNIDAQPSYGFSTTQRRLNRDRFKENQKILMRLMNAKPSVLPARKVRDRAQVLSKLNSLTRRVKDQHKRSEEDSLDIEELDQQLQTALHSVTRPQTTQL